MIGLGGFSFTKTYWTVNHARSKEPRYVKEDSYTRYWVGKGLALETTMQPVLQANLYDLILVMAGP